jgi:hypothetical protein
MSMSMSMLMLISMIMVKMLIGAMVMGAMVNGAEHLCHRPLHGHQHAHGLGPDAYASPIRCAIVSAVQ